MSSSEIRTDGTLGVGDWLVVPVGVFTPEAYACRALAAANGNFFFSDGVARNADAISAAIRDGNNIILNRLPVFCDESAWMLSRPADFDAVEVHGCATVGACWSSEQGAYRVVEQTDESPEFWSAFAHLKEGGIECIGDFETEWAATDFANRFAEAIGVERVSGVDPSRMGDSAVDDIQKEIVKAAERRDFNAVRMLAKELSRRATERMLDRNRQVISVPLVYESNGGAGLVAEASWTGDKGLYEEVRVSVFDKAKDCVADVLVTLDQEGNEPRVLITSGGDGDGDKNIAVFPMRPASDAVEVDLRNCDAQRQKG